MTVLKLLGCVSLCVVSQVLLFLILRRTVMQPALHQLAFNAAVVLTTGGPICWETFSSPRRIVCIWVPSSEW
jgi:hypothetical protein